MGTWDRRFVMGPGTCIGRGGGARTVAGRRQDLGCRSGGLRRGGSPPANLTVQRTTARPRSPEPGDLRAATRSGHLTSNRADSAIRTLTLRDNRHTRLRSLGCGHRAHSRLVVPHGVAAHYPLRSVWTPSCGRAWREWRDGGRQLCGLACARRMVRLWVWLVANGDVSDLALRRRRGSRSGCRTLQPRSPHSRRPITVRSQGSRTGLLPKSRPDPPHDRLPRPRTRRTLAWKSPSAAQLRATRNRPRPPDPYRHHRPRPGTRV